MLKAEIHLFNTRFTRKTYTEVLYTEALFRATLHALRVIKKLHVVIQQTKSSQQC